MNKGNRGITGAWIVSCILAFSSVAASHSISAAVFDGTLGTPVRNMQVPLNHSRVLVLDSAVGTITIGNPDVADIHVLDSRKIYVVGKSLGSTNVVLWNQSGGSEAYSTFTVDVTQDVDALKRLLYELMPEEKPEVRSSQGAIVLGGEISSAAKVETIKTIAQQFVKNSGAFVVKGAKGGGAPEGGKDGGGSTDIINMMQVGGPHQVMLSVKVAEVSRKVLRRLGVNFASFHNGQPWRFGGLNGGGKFENALTPDGQEVPIFPRDRPWTNGSDPIVGPPVDKFQPNTPSISAAGLFAGYLTGSTYFEMIIDASKDDGLAKVLAEPTLTTSSGEAATFLSGGEFPIPVWNGGGSQGGGITVVFKQYGISVKMLPTVLDSKRINMVVDVSVSELSDAASLSSLVPGSGIALAIPSLETRAASSTLEFMDGETIGIAGLLSDKMREVVTKFPGLGDLPVLGALFRSQQYQKDESELVMFVTAHLAKPINPKDIRLPTDAFTAPSDAEFFLMGRMEKDSERKDATTKPVLNETKAASPSANTGTVQTFGHQF